MIAVSPLAAEKLSAYLSDNKIDSPVRITVINDCSGPCLSLALDECKDNDHTQKNGNFMLVIDRDLSDTCGKVTVDFVEKTSGCGCRGGGGFSLTSEKPLPGIGEGCGSSCSSSGCGC